MNDAFLNDSRDVFEDSDVLAAERDVQRASAEFSARLQDASVAGREAATRVLSIAKPALIGFGLLAGLGLVVLAARRRGRPRKLLLPAPERTSMLSELARNAVLALATTAAQRIAGHLVEQRLSTPAGRLASPQLHSRRSALST